MIQVNGVLPPPEVFGNHCQRKVRPLCRRHIFEPRTEASSRANAACALSHVSATRPEMYARGSSKDESAPSSLMLHRDCWISIPLIRGAQEPYFMGGVTIYRQKRVVNECQSVGQQVARRVDLPCSQTNGRKATTPSIIACTNRQPGGSRKVASLLPAG